MRRHRFYCWGWHGFLCLALSGRDQLPGWFGMPASYYRDAFCVAILGAPAWMGLTRLPALLGHWPLVEHALGASVPNGLDSLNPAVSTISSAVWMSFFTIGIVGVVAGLIAAYVPTLPMRVGLALVVAMLMTGNVATLGSFLRDAAVRLVILIVMWVGVTRLIRFNLVGYFLLVAMISLVSGAVELLQQPNAYFHMNGYAILLCVLAGLTWPLVVWRRESTPIGG